MVDSCAATVITRPMAPLANDRAPYPLVCATFNGTMSFLPVDWISSDVLHLTTDASSFAFGAVFGTEWLQGSFPASWSASHISVKELLPILLAVRCWGSLFVNQRILFLSDNTAVVEVINKQTAKDNSLMDLVRQLVVPCMSHNICFRAKHMPGKTNVVADHISRLQDDKARLVQPTLARDKVSLRIRWLPWGKHP